MTPARTRALIIGVMAIPLAAGVLWLHALPPAHGPDEEAHLEYVRALATDRQFPALRFTHGGGWSEGHQPPLYYTVAAVASAAVGVDWSLRWLSLLMAVGSVVAYYGIARRLLPGAPVSSAVMAASAGLLPMFSFLSVSVNNGALVQLLVALALFVGVDPTRWDGRRGVGAAALVGGAILSKFSALFLLPYTVLAWVRLVTERRLSPSRCLALTGKLLLVVAVVAGWWFWRNWLLYGDVFGWSQQMAASPTLVRRERVSPEYLYAVTVELWRSLWAAFGPSARQTAGPSVYILVTMVAGVGAAGLVSSRWDGRLGRWAGAVFGGAIVSFLGWPLAVPWFSARMPAVGGVPVKLALLCVVAGLLIAGMGPIRWRPNASARREIALLGLAFLLLLAGVYRYNLDFPQPQGRFLLPCAPALVFFIHLGWIAIVGWRRRWFVLLSGLALAVGANLAALTHYEG
ncbi:glycosyltransferase family 39 protein [Candidatus Fermentibacteria bacterium]|nr:glycosyltransferase family 39 protein [Candidatus Fermentibacteria bacterium]